MEVCSVIDTAAFIWNREDFKKNPAPFYGLAAQLMTLLEIIESERPKILLRGKLMTEMINCFPCDLAVGIPNFYELSNAVYSFLANTGDRMVEFEEINSNGYKSAPDIVHPHFTDTVKKEVFFVIAKIHNSQTAAIYLTLRSIWVNGHTQLETINNVGTKTHETIIHSSKELTAFFNKFKPVFEHNPKHDRTKGWRMEGGEEVSPLSCFDGHDTAVPQKLLSSALKVEGGAKRYNYDDQNKTYVCFVSGGNNKFHAFDEKSVKIPESVKQHFHKE